MESRDPIQIDELPRYNRVESTPELSGNETETTLVFDLVPARAQGPTIAMLATYRLSGRYYDLYGSIIEGAVSVVAIDRVNGEIYHNDAQEPHAIPPTAVMSEDSSDTEGTSPYAVEGFFNFDLAQQLGLPPQKRTYGVFLWLDDIATEVKTVTMPANSNRPNQSPDSTPESQNYALVFDDQISVSPTKSGAIALERSSADSSVVIGTVGSDLLRSRKAEQEESPIHLGILGLCQQTRKVATRTREIPEEMRGRGRASFRINVHRFIECEAEEGPVYLLAYAGGVHSPVVTVDLS